MRKTLYILASSFRLTMQELMVNKLRTSLSLIGISFGIFCIIGVLATVNSLEMNIQNQIKSLGTNTIYIDKWQYFGGDADNPWWKFVNRPQPKFEEVNFIKQRSQLASNVAFEIDNRVNIEYNNYALQGVNMTGLTEEENDIQPLTMAFGRYISGSEFASGSSVAIIGYRNAENLFVNPSLAIGKEIKIKDHKTTIIGVIKKMGTPMIGEDYDQAIILPYRFAIQIVSENQSSPKILVKGKDNVSSSALADDLEGVMRSIRKLSPTQADNFTLNQISSASDKVTSLFSNINLGGWAIGILSLVVGAFGIANIMFVTVKERTSMIGLKKAIGARKRSILSEFLLEAAIICIMGGLMGLILVFLLTLILTNIFNFPVYISAGILALAISICIGIGILSGIIPAYIASRLDPVVAIRSK
ncbi:MAG: ABC transporter permease [Bacteroidota bacterium]|nr:ABC transporter permease [Bacteroidota bacterium]